MQLAQILKRRFFFFVFSAIVGLVASEPARAVVVYTYTGPAFDQIGNDVNLPGTYTTSDRLTLAVTFANAIAPNSSSLGSPVIDFWVSDGRSFLTLANLVSFQLQLYTDGAGNISAWSIDGHTQEPGYGELYAEFSTTGGGIASPPIANNAAITLCYLVTPVFCSGYYIDLARNSNQEGTWTRTGNGTDPGNVPLPVALPLFATGLGALGFAAWRRKRKAAR